MEIRRGTVRAVLREHRVPNDHIDHIMRTLEPFFQMVLTESLAISVLPIQDFVPSDKPLSTPPVREEFYTALSQSFLKDLLSLMQPGKIALPSEREKQFSSLMLEWILCESFQGDTARRNELRGLVAKCAPPSHT